MKRGWLWTAVAVTAVALVLRAWGLAQQTPTTDDLAAAFSAGNWVLHGLAGPLTPFHPHLRDFLVYASLGLFGPTAAGLKGWSVLLGALCVPLTGALVWRLSRNEVATVLAAALVAVDGVMIDYSRQAIQEMHSVFFLLVGTYLVVEAIVRGPSRSWRWLLPVAGVAFGLGTAAKFYAIPLLLAAAGWLLWGCWKRRRWDEALFVVTSLALVSFVTFFLTYAPWFGRGYAMGDWFAYQGALLESMVTHARTSGFLMYDKALAWFVQPFVGFADFAVSPDGAPHLSVATGNPIVWLAVLPAVVYSLVVKRSRTGHRILQTFFWASYLPLALSARPVWVLSSVAVLPFAFAIVALAAADVGKRHGRWIVATYAALAVVGSLLLYPLAVGKAFDTAYLRPIVSRMGPYADPATHRGVVP